MLQGAGEEQQRLAALYRDKSDEELLELDADIDSLTDLAQQTLRNEMKARRIAGASSTTSGPGASKPGTIRDERQRSYNNFYETPAASGEDGGQESDVPGEFTWKTLLCECETPEQVFQLTETLRRAGIDAWVQRPPGEYPRVLVAADQLEQARAIAAQPIPSDIVAESELPPQEVEFDAPVCPTCGAEDPVLESVEPSNTWHCEVCGNDWTEHADASPESADSEPR